MNIKLIKEVIKDYKFKKVTFQKWNLYNKVIYNGKTLYLDFDINNENELNMVCKILDSIFSSYNIVGSCIKVMNEEQEQKLEDFNTLLEILNKYKNL